MSATSPSDSKPVLIVGAGIGGLTAALCLLARGRTVEIFEQAETFSEIGAGIQISPNGMKVMRALGLADRLAAVAFRPQAAQMRFGRSGRMIFSSTMADYESKYGAPYLHVHRADLIALLRDAVCADDKATLHSGVRLAGYQQDGENAAVRTETGDRHTGSLVIGADGLHSVVRRQMLGDDAPRFTGNVAWRAVVPIDRLGDAAPPPTACVWVGPGRHAVTYRLRGGKLANFVGVVERPTNTPEVIESWSHTGSKAQALDDFAGWHKSVTGLIDKADTLHCWALYDRAPLPQWTAGRVALLGDACHPMLPFMAQGAVQAMEDAYVLAACLDRTDDTAQALQRYAGLRRPRTTSVQRAARRNAGLFHRRSKLGQLASYAPLWLAGRLKSDAADLRMANLYGHDVTSI